MFDLRVYMKYEIKNGTLVGLVVIKKVAMAVSATAALETTKNRFVYIFAQQLFLCCFQLSWCLQATSDPIFSSFPLSPFTI